MRYSVSRRKRSQLYARHFGRKTPEKEKSAARRVKRKKPSGEEKKGTTSTSRQRGTGGVTVSPGGEGERSACAGSNNRGCYDWEAPGRKRGKNTKERTGHLQ